MAKLQLKYYPDRVLMQAAKKVTSFDSATRKLAQDMLDTMYDLPNVANVEKVVVDESTIEENKPPLLVYREAAKKA